ncbi:MAG: hypothetical protein BAA01_08435 [Bacillus thermozeamaize]|uniref:NodB homology domain-containing protein n=1 Tax=Bacillus thermozeamaize TaxID=230954 RepID=A0A1Y3PQI5_9BACI|nr:MAG: hypothetical protein BAA01_08435 [Bacillus thermozeamaize]
MNRSLWAAFLFAGLLLLFVIPFLKPVHVYLQSMKATALSGEHNHAEWKNDPLWVQIQSLAERVDQPAENARIDPVWKAIPGYNGLVVDREVTYQLAKSRSSQPIQLIYQELPPQIDLKQLPPAPIYRGNPQKPMVGLMINVAWGEEHLPAMLEILREEQVKATFFLDGSWAKKNPEWVKAIDQQGHEIGNHAYSHPAMSKLNESEMERQISQTNQVIEQVIGNKPRYFAPPSGDFNQQVVEVAHRQGMLTILWTLDTVDWKKPAPELILKRIVPEVSNGNLILMHPTSPTVQALKPMIRQIRSKKLLLGTVSDVLSPARVDVVRLPEF